MIDLVNVNSVYKDQIKWLNEESKVCEMVKTLCNIEVSRRKLLEQRKMNHLISVSCNVHGLIECHYSVWLFPFAYKLFSINRNSYRWSAFEFQQKRENHYSVVLPFVLFEFFVECNQVNLIFRMHGCTVHIYSQFFLWHFINRTEWKQMKFDLCKPIAKNVAHRMKHVHHVYCCGYRWLFGSYFLHSHKHTYKMFYIWLYLQPLPCSIVN